jgi:hypothetical protein
MIPEPSPVPPLADCRLQARREAAWVASAREAEALFAAAEPELRQVFLARQERLGPAAPETLRFRSWLAFALRETGNLAAAEREARHTLAHYERSLGTEHLDSLRSRFDLAFVLKAAGYPEAACAVARPAWEADRRIRQPGWGPYGPFELLWKAVNLPPGPAPSADPQPPTETTERHRG